MNVHEILDEGIRPEKPSKSSEELIAMGYNPDSDKVQRASEYEAWVEKQRAQGKDVDEGVFDTIKDKFKSKKSAPKPKLKRNPKIKVAKGAGQVSRASDGNVYLWAGAQWVNNETAKMAPRKISDELGNPVLIGLANQIKKAGLSDVVKPLLAV